MEKVIEAFRTFMKITDGMTMGDILGWILAAIGGIIIYKAIDCILRS